MAKSLSKVKSLSGGDPVTPSTSATATSKVSPEQLDAFVNFLQQGKRSPMDYANEMSKRGYWGASEMFSGARDSAAGFAIDNRLNPNKSLQNYMGARKNSRLWHTELLQHVLGKAKQLGIKDKTALIANKDLLLKTSRMNPDDFKAVTSQPAGSGETREQNFWRIAGELYDDLNKKELAATTTSNSTMLAKK